MIHARIQEFSPGGVGVQVHMAYKKALTPFFFLFYFLVLNLFYRSPDQWLLSKKTIICQGSSGVEFFPVGGPTFYRGSNSFFPIETHITCDFPGGQTPSGSAHVIPRIVV